MKKVSKQTQVGWVLAGVGLVTAAVFGLGHWVRLRREDDFRRARLRRRIPSGEEREEMELAASRLSHSSGHVFWRRCYIAIVKRI